jgi:hypothetical protein
MLMKKGGMTAIQRERNGGWSKRRKGDREREKIERGEQR